MEKVNLSKITNKNFQKLLKQYPDDALISIEYCNPKLLRYNVENNIIYID